MARDYQRTRVYRAEDVHTGRIFADHDEVEAYVTKLVASAWFKKRWPRCRRITVIKGNSNWSASGNSLFRRITIPNAEWARKENVVLHEIAHVVAPSGAQHGPSFTGMMLAMIDKQMGRDKMKDVMQSFREGNVDWRMPDWWK